jgi:hypothetical protein
VLQAIINNGYSGHEPTNRKGDDPFITAGDFSTPNETYFQFVDTILDKANAQGFVVLFFYTYLGYQGGDQGWWPIINQPQNTQAVCKAWGKWLGNRYKSRPNVIWMVGGDFSAPAGEGLTRAHRILEGIRAAGAMQLAGAQWGDPDTLASDEAGFTSGPNPATADININTFYGYGPMKNGQTYQTGERAFAHTPPLPAIIFEPTYESDSNGPSAARESIRAYQYWAVLGGSTAGECFGAHSIWDWLPDWQSWLDSPGSQDMAQAFSLFATLPWQDMRPLGNAISAGQGEGNGHIAASVTEGGSWLLAYVPPSGSSATTFSVDLRAMAGAARARWWNPTSGAYTDITGGAYTLPNTDAARSFTTPGDNGTGTNDWVLAVDTNAVSSGHGSSGSAAGGGCGVAGTPRPTATGKACACGVARGAEAGAQWLVAAALVACAVRRRRRGAG